MVAQNLFGPDVTLLNPALGSDRVLAQRSGGTGKTAMSLDAIRAFVNLTSGTNTPVYDIKAFGATGNGSTDDTAAVQSAVNSGAGVLVSPGTYSVNTINLPSNGQGATLFGIDPYSCIFRARSPGQDIFRGGYNSTVQTRPGAGKQHMFANLGFLLNTGTGTDTSVGRNRCTTSGYAVGAAAIVQERTDFLTGNSSGSISDAWCTSFGIIQNCEFGVTEKFGNHRQVCFHSQGNAYGWNFKGMRAEGPHGAIIIAPPFVRRVSASSGTNQFTVAGGTGQNNFANGDQIRIAAHQITGSQPGGTNKNTTVFVRDKSGSTFRVAATSGGSAISLSSSGSGAIYAMRVGPGMREFSPDEVEVSSINLYSSPYGIGITNPERLGIHNVTMYSNQTMLELDGVPSQNRVRGIDCNITSWYCEGPQTAAGLSTDPCINIDCDGLTVSTLQVRGADSGSRPIYRFDGRNHVINGFSALSNLGAQAGRQPRCEFLADYTQLEGNAHSASEVVFGVTTGARKRIGRLSKHDNGTPFLFDFTEA